MQVLAIGTSLIVHINLQLSCCASRSTLYNTAYLPGLAAAWGTLTTEPAKGFFKADIRKGLESLAAKLPEVSILDDPEYARAVPAANAATRLATIKHLFGDSLPDEQTNFFQSVSGQTDLAWSALVQCSQTKRDFRRPMNHLVSSHAYDSMLKELFAAGAPLGSRRSRREASLRFVPGSCGVRACCSYPPRARPQAPGVSSGLGLPPSCADSRTAHSWRHLLTAHPQLRPAWPPLVGVPSAPHGPT